MSFQGASIIRMLEGMIGRNSLQQGLKDYLQKYHMSNAATDDLWDALNEVNWNIVLTRIMECN